MMATRFLVILLLGACAPAATGERTVEPADAGGAAILTDEPSYRFEPENGGRELDIEFTYPNRSGAVTYVARCGTDDVHYRLEKQAGASWVAAYQPICPMILVEPFEVAPGAALEGEIVIRLSPGTQPELEVDEVPGTYRLVLAIHDGWSAAAEALGDSLPESARASDPFTIEG